VTIVIDASVALKWVLDEPGREAADALVEDDLIAPELWLVEAANALWRRTTLGEITADEAFERLAELANAPVASLAMEPHLATALRLAAEIGHPVCDCLYLALALRYDTHVVTADRRFRAAAASLPAFADRVRLLGA
jgi:predicted nucleic acid-binding protein